MRLLQAMIYVKDLPRMAAFYGETLGLRPVSETRSDGWIEFKGGVALHAIPADIAAGIEIQEPAEARTETPIKLIFAVGDVDAEKRRLAGLGVVIVERPWPGAFDALDPEGNIFQVCAAKREAG